MNGLTLLNRLLQLQAEGHDLSQFVVIGEYTEYDPNIPYDVGCLQQHYPDSVNVDFVNSEITLGH